MIENNNNYLSRLDRARRNRRRNRRDNMKYIILAAAVLLIVALIFIVGRAISKKTSNQDGIAATGSNALQNQDQDNADSGGEPTLSAEQLAAEQEQQDKQAVIDSYTNLGLVQVSGYLNLRSAPQVTHDNIIGKLENNTACEILGEEGEWYHISSGGLEGYINSQFILSGDEAKEAAFDLVRLRAVVTTNKLWIRQEPVIDPANILGHAFVNERYVVVDQIDGWVQIEEGYISADYVDVRYALNEAKKLDLREMALNQYDNILISKVNGYLNIRSEPDDSGGISNVIGKMPGRAAGEILETHDGWYKIKSGNITGFVTANPEYIAVGEDAKQLALESANLMAIIKEEKMNVRKEPSLDGAIWTQLSQEERYPVVEQLDGWVKIELDSGEEAADAAYVSTGNNYVEVRYALTEAIKFSPLEEKVNQELSRRSQIVNYAVQFIGNPYVWGGTSLTKGADCSGFTMSVLANFGIKIPKYSVSQSKVGRAVSSSEMRPGDLVFYANSRGTINHVAMYIGNGQVVHAASRRSGIKISTWNYRRPKTIRNVID